MKFTGSHTLAAPRQQVWEALMDPAVLARTLPGCTALEVTGEDTYAVTVTAGVASVKGTYDGQVRLTDQQAPEGYTMRASGKGGPGTVDATVEVRLRDDGDGTRVDYDADATVGGTIAGVGQRVIQGVAKRNAGEFFAAVERELLHGPPADVAERPGADSAAEGARPAPGVGTVYAGRPDRGADDTTRLLIAAVVGALLALAGVLVGRRLQR